MDTGLKLESVVNEKGDLVLNGRSLMNTFTEFDLMQLKSFKDALKNNKPQPEKIDIDMILSTYGGQNVFSIC